MFGFSRVFPLQVKSKPRHPTNTCEKDNKKTKIIKLKNKNQKAKLKKKTK